MPVGSGHVVTFNFNPLHRDLNRGDQRMLWNTIINWQAIVSPPKSASVILKSVIEPLRELRTSPEPSNKLLHAGKPDLRNRLRKHDSDRHENRSSSRSVRNRNFQPRAFRIFVPAAKTDPALRQVLAHSHFFLKSSPANTRQHAGLYPRPIPARNNALFGNRASVTPPYA